MSFWKKSEQWKSGPMTREAAMRYVQAWGRLVNKDKEVAALTPRADGGFYGWVGSAFMEYEALQHRLIAREDVIRFGKELPRRHDIVEEMQRIAREEPDEVHHVQSELWQDPLSKRNEPSLVFRLEWSEANVSEKDFLVRMRDLRDWSYMWHRGRSYTVTIGCNELLWLAGWLPRLDAANAWSIEQVSQAMDLKFELDPAQSDESIDVYHSISPDRTIELRLLKKHPGRGILVWTLKESCRIYRKRLTHQWGPPAHPAPPSLDGMDGALTAYEEYPQKYGVLRAGYQSKLDPLVRSIVFDTTEGPQRGGAMKSKEGE